MTRRLSVALVVWACVGVLGGCRKPTTPAAAFALFQKAVTNDDPEALFDALDKRSRWAWMTVQKSHREAYDIILSNYPEGHERERELRRFERGATLGSARALFAEQVGRGALAKLPKPMPDAVRFEMASDGENAFSVLPSHLSLPFRRGPDGSWGYAAFADESEERQKRALGDVDMVRASAADYERAASRNAR
ncbi:MAG: hypothetical protein H7X95_10285 [Deltaproteobacteria bacterium]|nr:hypothetical protein [Deltaproteobacteria bacterium]